MAQKSKLNIEGYYQQDADSINNALKKAKVSHQAKNIPTAGDTVERHIREFIESRISRKYHTAQGHIVDTQLNQSPQFDILINDKIGSPVLASFDNGTKFLAYESIYAIGEVKSTYSKKGKEPISEFIEKIKFVNEILVRKKADIFQRSQDIEFHGNIMDNERTEEGWLYKNPLFKFMFFINSGTAKLSEIISILKLYDKRDLPNLICMLDKGIILNLQKIEAENKNGTISVELYPEFNRDGLEYSWQLCEFTKKQAGSLAYLIYAINRHLNRCVVLRADLEKYHEQFFHIEKTTF